MLAGIDWVIYYAKFKNIRIMNLSIGADSAGSYRTDPLAHAESGTTHPQNKREAKVLGEP